MELLTREKKDVENKKKDALFILCMRVKTIDDNLKLSTKYLVPSANQTGPSNPAR